jgi:hypothetical protein
MAHECKDYEIEEIDVVGSRYEVSLGSAGSWPSASAEKDKTS